MRNVPCRYCGRPSEDGSGVCAGCERKYERTPRRKTAGARIHSVVFDKKERPLRAVILTPGGIVEVEWKCVAGDWCWFSAGTGEAKRAAVPATERLQNLCGALRR